MVKSRGKGKKIMKVLLGIVAVFFVLLLILLAGAWSMFGDKVKGANSVKKLQDNLYQMEYKGDYGFDEFLVQGGAESDEKMAEYIGQFLSHGFMKTESQVKPQKFGCSTVSAKKETGGSIFGRNFDWKSCSAMVVYSEPKNGYKSISTSCLDYLGFGAGWKPEGFANQYMALAALYVPLDGINEKGLCVADLINGDETEICQDTGKADLTITSAIRLLLDKAATVEEAIDLLEQYDMHSSINTSHHLAIADAAGNSVVVEYVNNEMVVTKTPVVTNHYLSQGEKYGVGNEESHLRFERLQASLEENNGVYDEETMKECMEKVSYEQITQWSIVYDLELKTLYFYWQRDYDKAYQYGF